MKIFIKIKNLKFSKSKHEIKIKFKIPKEKLI